ncbi:MAG: DUF222 domain-containing protein [Gemmatimonadota bacterium]
MGYAVRAEYAVRAGYTVRETPGEEYGSRGPSANGRGAGGTGAPDTDRGAAPAPDSGDFDDYVEDLGDSIVSMAGHLHAGASRFLEMIAEFDRVSGWERGGHRNCACWLAYRAGFDAGTAREHVRVARALRRLPETAAAMSRGELSFSKVRALTRGATPATEADLVELAAGCTAAQLEYVIRGYKKANRTTEAALERERHESRTLSIFPDENGMYVVKGLLDPEVGALAMRGIEAASDALYRERKPIVDGRVRDSEREAARRRSDALGLLVERGLGAGFGSRGEGRDTVSDGGADGPQSDAPISGTRAARYQVVLHVEAETLAAEGEPGRSELEDGTRVSAETSRRVACDAGLVRVTRGQDGQVLDVGRRRRTIPPALRRALEVRDHGCRFPGCGLRFTDAHHMVHWADGGETSLENTVLLCRHHHRLVHEGGWGVESWGKGRAAFRDPRGSLHYDQGWERVARLRRSRPADRHATPRPGPDLTEALVEENRRRGIDPGAWTASARWKREADIPFDILCRATDAAL